MLCIEIHELKAHADAHPQALVEPVLLRNICFVHAVKLITLRDRKTDVTKALHVWRA